MEAVITINPGATKWDIREKVWDYIEAKNLANYPRPVHNRIPNFKGAVPACDRISTLQEFKSSSTVKVNPDRVAGDRVQATGGPDQIPAPKIQLERVERVLVKPRQTPPSRSLTKTSNCLVSLMCP
uniref:Methenyltetrahydrofolate synthase domain-containing protein n=1 Tax=Esox lucius TaxID=8010 RepID=A0A3P8ZUJ3_ESOLU